MSAYTFAYDQNGNCIADGQNALEIEYNYLNLVGAVKRNGAYHAKYRWAFDGRKLGVKNAALNRGYEYLGSLIYTRTGGSTVVAEGASFGSGRIIRSSGGYETHYFLTDHLGSVRAIVNGASGQVLERSDYHPYGSRHANPALLTSANRFRFSGKELQTTGDLPFMDFGARFMNGPIWLQVDPMCEVNRHISPYVYCSNNPVNRVDRNGMLDTKYVDEKGQVLADTDDGKKDVVVIPARNQPKFEERVKEHDKKDDLHELKTTEELNDLGYPIAEMKNKRSHNYPVFDDSLNSAYAAGYDKAYKSTRTESVGFWQSLKEGMFSMGVSMGSEADMSAPYRDLGFNDGARDKTGGYMNKFDPIIKNNLPSIKYNPKKTK